jgi:hypothetical protein
MSGTPDNEIGSYSDPSGSDGDWYSTKSDKHERYSLNEDEREWLREARRRGAVRVWTMLILSVGAIFLIFFVILDITFGTAPNIVKNPNQWLFGIGVGLLAIAAVSRMARWVSGGWRTTRELEDEIEGARQQLKRSLIQKAILPFLRDTLSKRLQSYDTRLRVMDAPGLSEVFEPVYEIPIAAATQLGRLLDRMPGGSIGISGPRGAGKSTLIRSFCYGKNAPKSPSLTVMVSAPAEYTARDFVLYLFATLCQEVLGQVDEDPLSLRIQENRMGTSASSPVSMRLLGLYGTLLVLGGVCIIGLFVGHVYVDPRVGWGSALIAVGLVLLGVSRPSLRLRRARGLPVPDDEPDLLQIVAARRLQEIQFQQTISSGWSGAAKSPIGLEAAFSGGATLARVQLSFPEIVAMLRRFLKLAATRGPVVLGIDELDKLPTDDRARQFLNEIKAIFGVKGCYYLVSISEEAMASFERRGLPFRDVFDSTFDEVIRVPYLSMADAQRLLNRRVVFPVPFLCFCYCLSGGLARDLIRFARRVVEAQPAGTNGDAIYPLRLDDAARRLIQEQVRVKTDATVSALKNINAEPEVSEVLQWCSRVNWSPVTSAMLLEQCESFVRQAASQPGYIPEGQQALMTHQDLVRVAGVLVGYYYYAATLLEFFGVEPDEERIRRALRSQEENGSLQQLALCQQAFSINPRVAWTVLSTFREAWKLRTVEFPSVLLGRGYDDVGSSRVGRL